MKRIIAIFASLAMILGFSLAEATPASATITQTRNQVIAKLNALRAVKCGTATSLRWSDGLTASAQTHANDMADYSYVAYDTPWPYETWAHRITRISGFNNVLWEFIDHTTTTPQALVDRMTMPNTTARKAALDCHFKVIGVGYAFRAPTGVYWTVDFSDQIVNVAF